MIFSTIYAEDHFDSFMLTLVQVLEGGSWPDYADFFKEDCCFEVKCGDRRTQLWGEEGYDVLKQSFTVGLKQPELLIIDQNDLPSSFLGILHGLNDRHPLPSSPMRYVVEMSMAINDDDLVYNIIARIEPYTNGAMWKMDAA